MKQIIIMLTVTILSFGVFANWEEISLDEMDLLSKISEPIKEATPPKEVKQKVPSQKHGHRNACTKINFSEDQKQAYKEVREIFLAETKELRMRFKNARKKYRAVLHNVKAPAKRADKLARRLGKISARLSRAKLDLFHTIVYDVANTDQRKSLLRCVQQVRHHMMMKKHHKGHKGKEGHLSKQPNKPS